MKDLINIINIKIKENIDELEATQNEIDKIKKGLKRDDMESARKMMILKDKLIFHKSCSLVLQDVIDEYRKGKL